uniref:Protein sleepless n=1 Tax=Caenorhabditis tropicalis TaxID=1561998 RepID=A0A1I7TJE2_9PELO
MRAVSFVILASFALRVSANISCFQCDSNEHPTCDVNDDGSLEAFKKTCPTLSEGPFKGNAAIGCRKISQNVEGVSSIVRECAYSGENVDGLKKTGNHGIQLYYYQCENEQSGEPCNSIGTIFSPISILTLIAIYLLQ